MNTLKEIIKKFKKLRVCVIGDAILDEYLHGEVERISREAPVPIVDTNKIIKSGGGAANTAINVSDLGAKSYFISVIGKDEDGKIIKTILKKKKVVTSFIIESDKRITLAKKRIIANYQALVRVDSGTKTVIPRDVETKIIKELKSIYNKIDALIISDYGYGVITPKVKNIIGKLQVSFNKILVVDAKYLGGYSIPGTTLVKPNFAEAENLIGMKGGTATITRNNFIWKNGEKVRQQTNSRIAAITADKNGAFIFDGVHKPFKTLATPNKNINAIGAGDTYTSTFALALSAKAEIKNSAKLAAMAADIVIKKSGTASCSYDTLLLKVIEKEQTAKGNKILSSRKQLKDLINLYRQQKKTIAFTNGCFDILHSGHVTYLAQAKKYGDVLILGLNSDTSVRRLKGEERPINNEIDRAHVLASLESITNIIIFSENTPINLIKIVKPDYFIKGGDYSRDTLPETPYVEKFGGEIVIIPLVQDKSTTNIIKKIKGVDDDNIPALKNSKRYYTNFEA
jgi:D-beta-D-heptose 7-phosphate kinase/D-beta-D-heptose 1-phosphate adenosyltransferase